MARIVPYPLFYYYPPETTYDVKGVFGGKFWAVDNQNRSFNSNFICQCEDFAWLFSAHYPGAPRWWLPIGLGIVYFGYVFMRGDAYKENWEDFEDLDYLDYWLLGSYMLDGYSFDHAVETWHGERFPNYYGLGEDAGIHFPNPEVACHTHNYVDDMYFMWITYITWIYAIFIILPWPVYFYDVYHFRPRRRFDYEMYMDSSRRVDLGRDCGLSG